MKCARLHLQERTKTTNKSVPLDKPRRYCQKRLVNPDHEEDPRWTDVLQRFHCNTPKIVESSETYNNDRLHQEYEDLFLSVQNLKFQGNEQQRKRPRTSFKYKKLADGQKHRMFVKQVVQEHELEDDDRSSQLTCYFFDDYAKYLQGTDRSRPSSGKSSALYQGLSNKQKENKTTQIDTSKHVNNKKSRKIVPNDVNDFHHGIKDDLTKELSNASTDETKIAFHKSGKRKSLTISRTQSPETVQVIRVEVICNYTSTSTMSDYDDQKPVKLDKERIMDKMDQVNMKKPHFTSKYMLTNTIKSLDERVSGGDKVTLLCKTFRLSDRSKVLSNKKAPVVKERLRK